MRVLSSRIKPLNFGEKIDVICAVSLSCEEESNEFGNDGV